MGGNGRIMLCGWPDAAAWDVLPPPRVGICRRAVEPGTPKDGMDVGNGRAEEPMVGMVGAEVATLEATVGGPDPEKP